MPEHDTQHNKWHSGILRNNKTADLHASDKRKQAHGEMVQLCELIFEKATVSTIYLRP